MARRLLPGALACVIVFVSFGYRFLSMDLTDDDYLFFAIGRQIQHFGEWPLRDLAEEGDPLHNVTSAALLGTFGYRLAGEVFFDLAMLSIAAALAFYLGQMVSGSVVAGLAASALAVLMAPRLYDYPKAIIPMLGLWCCLAYIRKPSTLRAAAAGLLTGLAFLLRHDLGLYLGLAALVTFVALRLSGARLAARSVGAYAGAAAICVVPYLLVVQMNGGLIAYMAASQRFVDREVSRSDDPLPTFAFDLSRPFWERSPGFPVKIRWSATADDRLRVERERRYQLTEGVQDDGRTWKYMLRDLRRENVQAIVRDPAVEDTANIDRVDPAGASDTLVERMRRAWRTPPALAIAPGVLSRDNGVAWLYYLLMALPYVALAALLFPAVRRYPVPGSWVRLAPIIGVSAAAGPFWLRGNMYENSRLADLAFITAVLGAWLLALAMSPRRPPVRAALAAVAIAVYVTTAGAVAAFADVRRAVDDGLVVFDRKALSEAVEQRLALLLQSPPPVSALSRDTGMRGAVEYLQRCTAPDDRVFMYGFYPEVLFFSGRASAADRAVVLRGFWTREAEQRRTIAAMKKGPAPLALIDIETAGSAAPGRFLDPSLGTLDAYLAQNYREAGTTGFGSSGSLTFRVLVDRQRTPTGTYAPLSLPCFA